MRKARKIFYFNIVEVALALAIVGIGVAGIMALFPVALNASRDAIGDNNAPDVAEQMLTYIQARANADTDMDWASGGNNVIGALSTLKPWDTASKTGEVNFETASQIAGTNIYTSSDKGVFGILQKTTTTDGTTKKEVVDFSAIIRIWKQQIPSSSLNVEGTLYASALDYKYGADVFVEVSWPSEKPYGQREKRVYMLELFNPNL